MKATAEKLPPNDTDAEEAVIASLMVAPDLVPIVADIVRPADFFREKNKWTYEAILEVHRRGDGPNQITVAHELARREKLEPIGGAAYLSRLVTELPTSTGARSWARDVHRAKGYRDLVQLSGKIAERAYKEDEKTVSWAMTRLTEIAAGARSNGFRSSKELLDEWLEQPELSGVAPPWKTLRQRLSVMPNGSLVVLAALTSKGKSSFALDLMGRAVLDGRRVAFISAEMKRQAVVNRMLAGIAGVDSKKIQKGELTLSEGAAVNDAVGRLAAASWWVHDSCRAIDDIELKAKAHKLEHGCDLLVVDHLQEIQTSTLRLNPTERTSEICERIRELAADLDVPVLLLCQLNRGARQRAQGDGEPRPSLGDLRQSGRIEEAAESILFLHDPSGPEPRSEAHTVEIIVAKQRMGETGWCKMTFWPAFSRFTD